VSEQQGDQTSGEPGSDTIDTGTHVSHTSDAMPHAPEQGAMEESMKIESPKITPDQDSSVETAAMGEAEGEAPKAEAPKVEAPEVEGVREPGKVMIMSPQRERAWDNDTIGHQASSDHGARPSGLFGKRRVAALAAVIALAAVTGAVGGALATSAMGHFLVRDDGKVAANHALEESIARVDADVASLKANLDRASKSSGAQFAKTNERIDKVEKAQAEPAAKLAKLSETVDKLRVPPAPAVAAVAATPVAAKETTASIPTPTPKPEIARLPTVDGWVLRDVANGGAMIEGRQGLFEVFAGDPVPGLGRVDAIRKQDGRWVVVTSKGLIVGR
jgi:hypothetical protein